MAGTMQKIKSALMSPVRKAKKVVSVSGAKDELAAQRGANVILAKDMIKRPGNIKDSSTLIDVLQNKTERKKLALKIRKNQ